MRAIIVGDEIDLSRLSFTLLLRALVVIPLATVAMLWPDAMGVAMVAAGGVIGLFGFLELAAGLIPGTPTSTRLVFFGHGLLSISFGILAGPKRPIHGTAGKGCMPASCIDGRSGSVLLR